ncbi:hypothetical protein Bpfe_029101, partial [Biomphalaria pfeifferi]
MGRVFGVPCEIFTCSASLSPIHPINVDTHVCRHWGHRRSHEGDIRLSDVAKFTQ